MPFPATLTQVTVTIQADLPPTGGATGWIEFSSPRPLLGATDGSIVPRFTRRADLAADGSASIQLPATNDPQWAPINWAYAVEGRIAGQTITGTLQLDYQDATADFAALFQPDGAAVAGQSYLLVSQRGAASGVASLDANGLIPTGQLPPGAGDNIVSTQITDSTATGRAVLTAANAAAGRTALGALSTAGGTVTGDLAIQGTLRVTPGAVVEIGPDTNLYRAGTNKLGTDDALDVGGQLHSYTGISTDGSITAGGTNLVSAIAACTSIYYWNGSSYDLVTAANVYVGGTGPAVPTNGDVVFES
jgi:hypothetical protein